MTDEVMFTVRASRGLRDAAHMTARISGQSTEAWLNDLIKQNLHPSAASIFLPADAQQNEHNQSIPQPTPAA